MNAQPKKAANLTISAELLESARSYKINLSQTLETALAAELKNVRCQEFIDGGRRARSLYTATV